MRTPGGRIVKYSSLSRGRGRPRRNKTERERIARAKQKNCTKNWILQS